MSTASPSSNSTESAVMRLIRSLVRFDSVPAISMPSERRLRSASTVFFPVSVSNASNIFKSRRKTSWRQGLCHGRRTGRRRHTWRGAECFRIAPGGRMCRNGWRPALPAPCSPSICLRRPPFTATDILDALDSGESITQITHDPLQHLFR